MNGQHSVKAQSGSKQALVEIQAPPLCDRAAEPTRESSLAIQFLYLWNAGNNRIYFLGMWTLYEMMYGMPLVHCWEKWKILSWGQLWSCLLGQASHEGWSKKKTLKGNLRWALLHQQLSEDIFSQCRGNCVLGVCWQRAEEAREST